MEGRTARSELHVLLLMKGYFAGCSRQVSLLEAWSFSNTEDIELAFFPST